MRRRYPDFSDMTEDVQSQAGVEGAGRFRDRVAIVTGAAGGIGRQVVRDLVGAGARVVAGDLDRDRLRAQFEGNGRVTQVAGDVASAEGRRELLDAARALGTPWHLVNTHGINPIRPIPEMTEELWDTVFAVNTKSVFFLCRDFAETVPEGGSIVNFSSLAGKEARTVTAAPYNATKAAVMAITKTFAQYLAPRGVRVNCVCPGIIDTPLQDSVLAGIAASTGRPEPEVRAERAAWSPLGRMGTPSEVSSVVLFLLSDASAYMTGQSLNLTGGTITY